MDNKIIDLVMSHIEDIKQDVKSLDNKLDQIIEWKLKLVGATIVVSGIISVIFQITLALLQKGT
jgi:hypothetical protein